jgi:hypothetical protein
MKRTAQQQAVLDLMLEEYPGAKDLPKREQVALADVYGAEGAIGVERILSAVGGHDGGPPLSNTFVDGYSQALPHCTVIAHGKRQCICESKRCPQWLWFQTEPGRAWLKNAGMG